MTQEPSIRVHDYLRVEVSVYSRGQYKIGTRSNIEKRENVNFKNDKRYFSRFHFNKLKIILFFKTRLIILIYILTRMTIFYFILTLMLCRII